MCCSASLFLYFTLMMMTFSSCNIITNSSQELELETMPLFFPLDYSSKSFRFSWASSSSSSLFHTEKVTRQPDYSYTQTMSRSSLSLSRLMSSFSHFWFYLDRDFLLLLLFSSSMRVSITKGIFSFPMLVIFNPFFLSLSHFFRQRILIDN